MNPDFTTVFWRVGVGQILTIKELSKYLKLTNVTIYKYLSEGKIPGFKVGSRWRFD
ncbi:MAG: helix-turn-helix domain-containing protein, partial [Deltaproteobacteria bacterium]|nr:helix-turn-helix domain-containing protein [Deltaproteobacteria bacterium]